MVNKLDQSTLPEDQVVMCQICFCELEVEEELLLHPSCKHVFHWECLTMWLKKNCTCPICRTGCRTGAMLTIHDETRRNFATRDEMLIQEKKEMKKTRAFTIFMD